jgi:5-methylcytosine-specific restriction enzyme subunit McrC
MLSLAEGVSVKRRGVALLAAQDAPISEILAATFAERLHRELLVGSARAYVGQEENLCHFKGKLAISKHISKNASLQDRFYCKFDEFSSDTPLNRIFKAACRFLAGVTRLATTQDSLRWCLALLDGVADVEVQGADLDRIVLDRQNERFADVFHFCRLLLAGRSPNAQAGEVRSFSLLFDMNQVFERFIASFLRLYVIQNIEDCRIWPQAKHQKRYLMQCEGRGVLGLEPDLLIEAGGRRFVMDTKWKRLRLEQKTKGNLSEADLYQLYAYVRRYGCDRGALLYPHARGFEERRFSVLDAHEEPQERFLVCSVNLHRDLWRQEEQEALAQELEKIVREGLGL